jgi:hypothetical protein
MDRLLVGVADGDEAEADFEDLSRGYTGRAETLIVATIAITQGADLTFPQSKKVWRSTSSIGSTAAIFSFANRGSGRDTDICALGMALARQNTETLALISPLSAIRG